MEATQTQEGIAAALGRVPSGLFILTAKHEDRRAGMLASWVQQACFQPPMISISIAKGRPILPLISESRRFGLCQVPEGEKVILRKFAGGVDISQDPFLGFDLLPSVLGVPILSSALAYLECEVTCHMDVEGDHDLFIGTVHAGGYIGGQPRIHLRENGLAY